ncbi:fimbrial protein [Klebsiella sp. BIGb0407]|uniref:fimbrial protein n=1 Tax=Klebsiella sp. BIGb0407 TaxID=2940603 RepID=UPI00216905C9|nr:fimbrial protein [Klebsiella sp. BIGb0407]MCS3433873.1 type 1 fimbria pilin [Klebsiella sp. BIGb0407]
MFKNKVNIDLVVLTLLILSSLFFSLQVRAVPATFHGTLIDYPPCDINSVDVEFNEIGISQIDGTRYKQPFKITIECQNTLGTSVPLYLGYEGMVASFNSNALQTSKANLGIIMYHAGTNDAIPPNNQDIPVTMSSGGKYDINLEAVPVKDSTPPSEGSFTATGRVEIRYP